MRLTDVDGHILMSLGPVPGKDGIVSLEFQDWDSKELFAVEGWAGEMHEIGYLLINAAVKAGMEHGKGRAL